MSLSKQNLNSLFLALLGAIFGAAATWYFAINSNAALIDQPSIILGHEMQSVEDCSKAMLGVFSEEPKMSTMTEINNSCYDKLRYQGLLNDFQIRRTKFAIQYTSERVILWMVVLLTFSGVLLAGLQLFATYRLARRGQASGMGNDNELTVEQGKLVFRSSVSGLLILVCSFAFFYTYIFNVFTIKELPTTAMPGTNPFFGSADSPVLQTTSFPSAVAEGQNGPSGANFNPYEFNRQGKLSSDTSLSAPEDKKSPSGEKKSETGEKSPSTK